MAYTYAMIKMTHRWNCWSESTLEYFVCSLATKLKYKISGDVALFSYLVSTLVPMKHRGNGLIVIMHVHAGNMSRRRSVQLSLISNPISAADRLGLITLGTKFPVLSHCALIRFQLLWYIPGLIPNNLQCDTETALWHPSISVGFKRCSTPYTT